MQHRPSRKVGGGLQVDLQGARPRGAPFLGVCVDADRLEHPGVVDQDVDAAVQPLQRPVPEALGRAGDFEVFSEAVRGVLATVSQDLRAACAQRLQHRRPDAAARSGDEDVRLGFGHTAT